MPLPFLLLGVAALAGGYGVKKGLDAKDDFDTAGSVNREAAQIYDNAKDALDQMRTNTQSALESLGRVKFDIYKSSLIPFVDTFQQIKNIDFKDAQLFQDKDLVISKQDMLSIEEVTLQMQEIVTGGIGSLGAGGLAGLAAYGGVGAIGAASTGTAIGTLSGAAATNATLAWFGGGSIAAGGMGMAGGMAVLGGIVAGPVLAVGGMMIASKAKEAKEDAYANREKAKIAVEQMNTATTAANGIKKRCEQINSVLTQMNQLFAGMLVSLRNLVKSSTDYRSYTEADKKGVMMTAMLAKTIKNVVEAPVFDERGAVTQASRNVLDISNNVLKELRGEGRLVQAEGDPVPELPLKVVKRHTRKGSGSWVTCPNCADEFPVPPSGDMSITCSKCHLKYRVSST